MKKIRFKLSNDPKAENRNHEVLGFRTLGYVGQWLPTTNVTVHSMTVVERSLPQNDKLYGMQIELDNMRLFGGLLDHLPECVKFAKPVEFDRRSEFCVRIPPPSSEEKNAPIVSVVIEFEYEGG